MKPFIPEKSPRKERSTWDSSIKLGWPIQKKIIMIFKLQDKMAHCMTLSDIKIQEVEYINNSLLVKMLCRKGNSVYSIHYPFINISHIFHSQFCKQITEYTVYYSDFLQKPIKYQQIGQKEHASV